MQAGQNRPDGLLAAEGWNNVVEQPKHFAALALWVLAVQRLTVFPQATRALSLPSAF